MLPEAYSKDEHKPLVWSNWHSQLQHRITTVEQLREWINVTRREEKAIEACAGKYRWSVTPYYASLMDKADEMCPKLQRRNHERGRPPDF